VVDSVCVVPHGAHPSYAHGYYDRDNVFYRQWDEIARDRTTFLEWIDRHIRSTADFAEYEQRLAEATAMKVPA
jgi:glutaconate CoA-transferase subunit A